MLHTLIVVGFLGSKRAYLDVSMDEAQRRFIHTEGYTQDEIVAHSMVSIIAFDDEFGVYDAWE